MKDRIEPKDEVGSYPFPTERIYPCAKCGKLRSKDEGGTVFTLCEECWDKHYKDQPINLE